MDYISRAMKAYRRAGGPDQPSALSHVWTDGGNGYVCLRNITGLLAVYRIIEFQVQHTSKKVSRLKRLKRYPRNLPR
jgi:hypothetical protein